MVRPAGPNVLAELDQRPATAFYWRLTLLSTIGGFLFGYDTSNIGATAYIAEYAPRGRRGALSILQQWMITVGILAAFLVALVILWALPHSARNLDWRL